RRKACAGGFRRVERTSPPRPEPRKGQRPSVGHTRRRSGGTNANGSRGSEWSWSARFHRSKAARSRSAHRIETKTRSQATLEPSNWLDRANGLRRDPQEPRRRGGPPGPSYLGSRELTTPQGRGTWHALRPGRGAGVEERNGKRSDAARGGGHGRSTTEERRAVEGRNPEAVVAERVGRDRGRERRGLRKQSCEEPARPGASD